MSVNTYRRQPLQQHEVGYSRGVVRSGSDCCRRLVGASEEGRRVEKQRTVRVRGRVENG